MADTKEVKIDAEAGADEVVVPPVDEGELDKALNEGADAGETTVTAEPSDSSTDDGSTAGDEKPGGEPAEHSIKPVEGETPRERALREEITKLREDRRRGWQSHLASTLKPPSGGTADERLKKLKQTYSDEEIRNMEEAIDVLASSKGYVKRADTYQDIVNQTLDNFIETHPEYNPSQDKDDVRWSRFQEIITSDYNLNGKTAKQLTQIFNKVNRDVEVELGEAPVKQKASQLAAQQQKIKSVSHSGGTQASSGKKANLDPEVRKMFKGFDDEDLV